MGLTAREYHTRDYAANKEKYRERNKRYYEQHRLEILGKKAGQFGSACHGERENLSANKAVVVIRDPIPLEDGGYMPGKSMFPVGDLPYMLECGSLVDGTIIEKSGKRYVVQLKKLERVI